MNRLDTLIPYRRSNASNSNNQSDHKNQSAAFSLNTPHRLFAPEHYEARYEYPLVIWLHSDGSSEMELGEVMPNLSLRNYVAVGLRGPRPSRKLGNFFRWGLDESTVSLSEELIFESIRTATNEMSINSSRVFLAGYGTGGSLAQHIGLRYPERFAGVVSINGAFPDRPRVLSRWKQAKQLPILWMHGNQSHTCGLDALCDMLHAAYPAALNIHPMQFAVGDVLATDMLASANRFMMQIVTGQPISLVPEPERHEV